METITRDKAMQDERNRSHEIEELVKPPVNESEERFAAARTRTQASLRDAYAGLSEMGSEVGIQARGVARAADRYVHEKPWQTLGAVLGVGLLFGYLLGRQ